MKSIACCLLIYAQAFYGFSLYFFSKVLFSLLRLMLPAIVLMQESVEMLVF